MARDLDPGSSPAAFLGAELRRARVAAGMSQEQFSRTLGFDRTVITKAEDGERPPSPEVAAAIDEAFSASGRAVLPAHPTGSPSERTVPGLVPGVGGRR